MSSSFRSLLGPLVFGLITQVATASPTDDWSALKAALFGQGATPQEKSAYRRTHALELADRAHDFYVAYPDDEHAFQARLLEFSQLLLHYRNQPNPTTQQRLQATRTALEALPGLNSSEQARRRDVFLDQELESLHPSERTLAKARTLITEFPGDPLGYQQLLMIADHLPADQSRTILQEVLANPQAPQPIKDRAQALFAKLTAAPQPYSLAFTALDGQAIDIAHYRGQPVLLVCWASWCQPCLAEIPELKAIYERWHDRGLVILGLSADHDRTAMEKAIATHQIPWPQYYHPASTNSPALKALGVMGVPQIFLVGADGVLRPQALPLPTLSSEIDALMTAHTAKSG